MRKLFQAALLLIALSGAAHAGSNWTDWDNWNSSENAHATNHMVFTSSSVYVKGILISSPGIQSTFAYFDSSSSSKVDGNFLHIATVSTARENGAFAGQIIPIERRFSQRTSTEADSGFGFMTHNQGVTPAKFSIIYGWPSLGVDRTLGN